MKRNNLGVAILRKICLRDAEMIVIQTAKAKEKRRIASGADRAMVMEEENMEAMWNLQKTGQPDCGAGKDNIYVQMRWLPKPQRSNHLDDAISLFQQR